MQYATEARRRARLVRKRVLALPRGLWRPCVCILLGAIVPFEVASPRAFAFQAVSQLVGKTGGVLEPESPPNSNQTVAPAADPFPAEPNPNKPTFPNSSAPELSLPSSPAQGSALQPPAAVNGVVIDDTGAAIPGATITLDDPVSHQKLTATSDGDGLFSFGAVIPGAYNITVAAAGFAPWAVSGILTHSGQDLDLPAVELQVASVDSTVQALSVQQVAEQQLYVEEQQRLIGIVPNFYVTYNWNAAPLSPGQKFRLGLRNSYDPFTFVGAGIGAGIEQGFNQLPGYGQGGTGYAKRFGASYADNFDGTMIGGVILPILLHQDPRYFYKGTGSIPSRALYAISTVVICKGDNGKWQPNYSNVLGNLAAAGISNAYYPASDRNGAGLTIGNALIGTAGGAIGSLFQEFLIKKISRGIPPPAVPSSVTRP